MASAMFDEDLRLAAWNRNFQQILDLPDEFSPSVRAMPSTSAILAERGEFGTDDIEAELSRRLEETDQELRFERTRPDGRVIEVRRNPVPDGGFVLIYSDITERKRSEAEIRAARDAAEAAYRDLKTAQASLIQAEKMASLGQLTAGIAHEIKNPLNFVNNFADLSVELLDELKETAAPAIAALGDEKRAEVDETIDDADRQSRKDRRAWTPRRWHRQEHVGTFAWQQRRTRSVDLNGLIEEALNLAYHGARAQDQSFNITLERDFAARHHPDRTGAPGHHPRLSQPVRQWLLRRHQTPEGGKRPEVQADPEGVDAGSRRCGRSPRPRQRHRHSARDQGQAVSAVLHDEADRRGDRPRPLDQLRHRDPTARRHDHGR